MYKCRKCNGTRMAIKPNAKNPAATDLYCSECGAWLKFANKDDIRLYSVNSGEDEMTMEDYHTILESLEIALSFETDGDFATRVRAVYRKIEKVMEEYL